MDTQTRIYIANLGKYNEGELVGEWIALPFDEEEIHNLFVKIGVGYKDESGEYHHGLYENGCWYEEYAIHDFESALNSFNPSEYDDIFELSEQIERIEKLDSIEIEVYNAMRENGLEFEDAMEKINDGDYIWYDGCSDMADVARQYADEVGLLDSIPESLQYYFDFEAYGRDMLYEGSFIFTDSGCVQIL